MKVIGCTRFERIPTVHNANDKSGTPLTDPNPSIRDQMVAGMKEGGLEEAIKTGVQRILIERGK